MKGKSTAKRYRKEVYGSIKHLEKEIFSLLFLYFYTILKERFIKKYIHKREEKEAKAIKEEIKKQQDKAQRLCS